MRTSPTPKLLLALFLLTTSSRAWAQDAAPDGDCPPGSWFCEDNKAPPAETPPKLPPPTPTPPPKKAETAAGSTTVVVPGAQPAPPVVVYQQAPPAPPPVVVVRRNAPVYHPPPPPPPKLRHRLRKWGFNTRLLAAMMDAQQNESAAMGGLGFSFRARPVRHFAIDVGLDFVGGKDYEGKDRTEVPFSVSGMVYVNPRSVVQLYMLGGIGWSHARVEDQTSIEDYDYFGGQLGGGLEIRLSPPLSLNFDRVGFVRGRTDNNATFDPEFTNPQTGETTNTSGGGLLRGGVTFYW